MSGFGSPFDWDSEDEFPDEFGEPEDADENGEFPWEESDFFPVFDPMSGMFTVVERIREYVQTDYSRYTPDVVREIEAVQRYIDGGITQFEALLQRHAEFDAWLAEKR